MAKKINETAIKGLQTKLEKKSYEELVQIILKKYKIERNLNNQIKALKGEVNALSTKVHNFGKDMEGTLQTLDTYKDKVKTLQEKNDAISSDYKDTQALFEEEHKKAITLENKLNMWKVATYIITAIAIVAIISIL